MKAGIAAPCQPADRSREQVFAGMLLHIGKTGLPVNEARYRSPRQKDRAGIIARTGPSDPVADLPVPDLYVCYGKARDRAGIRALAPLLGEEQGLRKRQPLPVEGKHLRFETAGVSVLFIQFSCSHFICVAHKCFLLPSEKQRCRASDPLPCSA